MRHCVRAGKARMARPGTTWMPGKSAITWSAGREESDVMNRSKERMAKMPKFPNEDEEAKWWASGEGRELLKQQSAAGTSRKRTGSPLVGNLSRAASVQIALARAGSRQGAQDRRTERDWYQTLLKDPRAFPFQGHRSAPGDQQKGLHQRRLDCLDRLRLISLQTEFRAGLCAGICSHLAQAVRLSQHIL